MDYLILTLKKKLQTTCGEVEQITYVCANSFVRCKDDKGNDVLLCVSSGVGYQIPMEHVVAITPSTPTQSQVNELR